VDTVAIQHRWNFPTDPGFDIHVGLERRAHQVVPEVFVPLAILGDHLERQSAARFALDDIRIAGSIGI
jgi:hypothetical protein